MEPPPNGAAGDGGSQPGMADLPGNGRGVPVGEGNAMSGRQLASQRLNLNGQFAPAMALTDRDGLYGSSRFFLAMKKLGLRGHTEIDVSLASVQESEKVVAKRFVVGNGVCLFLKLASRSHGSKCAGVDLGEFGAEEE
jgi:hypothetical protein